jgi:hypothetical protein
MEELHIELIVFHDENSLAHPALALLNTGGGRAYRVGFPAPVIHSNQSLPIGKYDVRIRSAAQEPGFLAGVIRHIMEDDRIAAAFAAEEGLSAEELTAAAAALGGHWERETP